MKLVLFLGLGYLAYAAVMVWLHPRFIYPFSPEGGVLPGVSERELTARDGTPLYVQEHKGDGPVLVYFMGNAGALPLFESAFDRHIRAGRHIIAMEYRGGGGRPGVPREARLKSDALIVMEEAEKLGRPVIVQGYSMGSGLATFVAARRKVAGVVLVNPFDSMCRLMSARSYLPACRLPFVDHWRSFTEAGKVEVPILVLHGDADQMIPPAYSTAFEALPNVTRRLIAGAAHGDIGSFPAFGETLDAFIETLPQN